MTTPGTQIASMTTKGLLALVCASFMGCVVTNKIDFQLVPAPEDAAATYGIGGRQGRRR